MPPDEYHQRASCLSIRPHYDLLIIEVGQTAKIGKSWSKTSSGADDSGADVSRTMLDRVPMINPGYSKLFVPGERNKRPSTFTNRDAETHCLSSTSSAITWMWTCRISPFIPWMTERQPGQGQGILVLFTPETRRHAWADRIVCIKMVSGLGWYEYEKCHIQLV